MCDVKLEREMVTAERFRWGGVQGDGRREAVV